MPATIIRCDDPSSRQRDLPYLTTSAFQRIRPEIFTVVRKGASSVLGSRHTVPVLLLFLIVQILLLGSLLWSGGLPKGVDVNATLVAGYASENDSWGELWDDSRSPGSPKHITRLTSTELVVTWLTDLTGNVEASTRFMAWLLRTLAPLMMYAFFFVVSRSRSGAVAAALIYLFARGAALYAGLPLSAGYALLPLWLLALDRSLIQPRIQMALLFGVVSAALLTATIPGFTYLSLLVGAVYTVSFVITRVATSSNFRETAKELVASGRTLAIGTGIALALSAYFIFAAWLSTIPLVDETGGYELSEIATRLPLLSDAAALQPIGFTQGPLWLDAVVNALIVFVALTAAIAFNFRIGAFLFIYVVAILFASDVTSSAYTFLFDNVPYFSLMRGAGRWIAVATLSVSFLTGTAVAMAVSGRTVASDYIQRRLWATIMPGAMVLAWGSLIMVLIFVGTHTPAIREWNTPYSVDPTLIDAFEFIDNLPGNPAFATAPFLETRLSGDPFISAIDFGRTLGPGTTGSTAFGGLRSGGLSINENAAEIAESLKTPAVLYGDVVVFPGQFEEIFVAPDNFQMLAIIPLDERNSQSGTIEVQFRDRTQNEQIQLNIDPQGGVIQVFAGPQLERSIGAVQFDPSDPSIGLEVRKSGSNFRVSLSSEQFAEVNVAFLGATSVLVRTSSDTAELRSVEVSKINPSVAIADDVVVRLLDLYRVQYMLVQPHASRIEASRISAIENLNPVESWGDAQLFQVEGNHPGHAYVSEEYGLYSGSASQMIPGLYQVNSLADSLFPLVAVEDAESSSERDGLIADATFIGILNPADSSEAVTEISRIFAMPNRPPLIVLPRSINDLKDELGSPYSLAVSQFVNEPTLLWRSSRNYVFEAEVKLQESLGPGQAIQFINSSVSGRPVEIVNLTSGNVEIIDVDGSAERVLSSKRTQFGTEFRIRIVQIGDSLSTYINNTLITTATLGQAVATGPLTVRSTGEGFTLSNLALATNREGPEFLEAVAENGFSIATLITSGYAPRRDLISLFPALSGRTVVLRQLPPSGFRVLVEAESSQRDSVGGFITSGSDTRFLEMEYVLEDETGPGAWYLSDEIPPGMFSDSSMAIFAQGQSVEVTSVLLIEERRDVSTRSFVESILNDRSFAPVSLEKNSSTFYSGEENLADAKLLVFRDSFNTGWELESDGADREQVRLFGSLAGFWVTDVIDADPQQLELRFRPQSTFTWGKVISALAFVVLLAVLTWRYRSKLPLKGMNAQDPI